MTDVMSQCGDTETESTSSSQTYSHNPFGFHGKTSFDALGCLLRTRSESFQLPPKQIDRDIWKRPPPDFRYVEFNPHPAKRNTRNAIQPWKYARPSDTFYEGAKMQRNTVLPKILQEKAADEQEFITRVKTMDSLDAKLDMVRELTHVKEPYQPPALHDFRAYPPLKKFGLPEFLTENDKDPYNINFRTQSLDIIHGINTTAATERDCKGRQMAPPLPRQPRWEHKYILPNSEWPRRPASYTRHRRIGRPVYSAFMERVEDQLTHKWDRERTDEALASVTCQQS